MTIIFFQDSIDELDSTTVLLLQVLSTRSKIIGRLICLECPRWLTHMGGSQLGAQPEQVSSLSRSSPHRLGFPQHGAFRAVVHFTWCLSPGGSLPSTDSDLWMLSLISYTAPLPPILWVKSSHRLAHTQEERQTPSQNVSSGKKIFCRL